MKPKRRLPDGLETPASRGFYRIHTPIDNSCQSLDMEELPFGSGGFSGQLLSDMYSRPLSWLDSHYPELTFSYARKVKDAKRHEYHVLFKPGLYRVADWRKK